MEPRGVSPIKRAADSLGIDITRRNNVTHWQSKKPDTPGWYWLKSEDGVRVVELTRFWESEELTVMFIGTDETSPISGIDGEWAGPIGPPL
jgi:hypothetical protein